MKSASLLACALLAAAPLARADHAVARQDLATADVQPGFYDIQQRNSHMRDAVHQARRSVGYFITALRKPSADQYDFQVKKPFRQGLVVEHLWLAGITFSGNRFHGYVDNKPHKIKGLKFGQRVSVDPNEISDWAFVQNGRLVGGYTIRVLYAQLSPAEKRTFQQQVGFRISTHR